MSEAQTQREILLRYGTDPRLKIWRNNTGTAKDPVSGRVVRFGVPGQADISGLLRNGVRIEIEVKSRTGKQREAQVAFQEMVRSMRGIYVLARSVEEVEDALCAALNNERAL